MGTFTFGEETIGEPAAGAKGSFGYGGEVVGKGDPSLFETTAGALAVGAYRDPILKFAIDTVGQQTEAWQPQDIEALANRIHGSRLADVFEIVGEWGPTLAAGAGLYAAGRAAAVGGLRLAASGKTTGQLGKVATRAADYAGNLGVTSGRIADLAGGAAPVARLGKPMIERGAEMAGGALGIGGLSGAEELAAGGEAGDVLKSFALGAGLTLGFEGALVGLGKLTKAGRTVELEKVKESIRKGRPQRRIEETTLKGDVVKMSQAYRAALNAHQQERELLREHLVDMGLGPASKVLKTTPGVGEMLAPGKRKVDVALMGLRKAKEARRQKQLSVRGFLDATDYIRDTPFNPKGKREAISVLLAKAIKTPEGMARELGPTMVRLAKDAGAAETEIAVGRAATMVIGASLRQQAGQVLGIRNFKKMAKDKRYTRMFHEWEKGGDDAVEAYLNRIGRGHMMGTAREMFDNIRGTRQLYDQLVKLGAEPVLTNDELARLGVREWLPHVLSYNDEAVLTEQLAKSFMLRGAAKEEARLKAERIVGRVTKDGLAKFGSIDHQRELPGTLARKIHQKIPLVEDPIEAVSIYIDQATRRLAYGSRFGFKGELKDSIIRQATAEGANSPLVHTIADTLLAHKYYLAAERRLYRNITDMETATKLALAVIPNMSQTINTVLFNGYRNTAKAVFTSIIPGLRRDQFAKATGIAQASYDLARHLFQETNLAGSGIDRLLQGAARNVLKRSGFEMVENWNRFVGGTAGAYTIRRDLSRAIAGRLRGNSLDAARRRMRSLGINLDEMVFRARREASLRGITPEEVNLNNLFKAETVAPNGIIVKMGEFDRAIFNAAKQTQFTPDATRLPAWWQTPQGRVVFQFKRFALSQGRFLRDQVLAEAAHGNMKPLASFIAIYPAAGELVADARYAARAKDRDQNGIYRIMTNLGYVGGFGLAWDTLAAAKWGRLGSTLLGPAAGDIIEVAETIAQGQSIGRFFTRQPVAQAANAIARGAAYTVGGILALVDQEERTGAIDDETISIEDLIREGK